MLLYLAAGAAFVLLVRRGDGPYVLAGALAADWLNGGFIGIQARTSPRSSRAGSRKVACACERGDPAPGAADAGRDAGHDHLVRVFRTFLRPTTMRAAARSFDRNRP
jgi:hypothetical protein